MFKLSAKDLPELERLAKSGYGWIARDWNEQVYAYTAKPFKNTTTWVGGAKCEKIIGLGINSQIGVRWSDPEPLNIAAAIAQIKAGIKPTINPQSAEEILNEFCEEQDKKPLTWNERINQMTVEEKADVAVIISNRCSAALEKESCPDLTCWQCFIEFLDSPYTEGETK